MAGENEDTILERNIETLLTRAHEPPKLGDEARARVLATLQAARRSEGPEPEPAPAPTPLTKPRRNSLMPGLLALAALLGLIWMGAIFGGSGKGLGSGETYANEGAAPMQITLADGSQAILRAGSRIEEVARREIRLVDGELLLEVARDAEPFIVHTEHGRAIALGTRFSVRTEAARILTSVVRGRVRLEAGSSDVLLRAGEQGFFGEDEVPQKTLGERLSHTLAWARTALAELDGPARTPVRRGNLIARDPRWQGEWPLPIRNLVVDVHVEDGIARTTIDQTFFNHVNRQLEGVYSFPLPSDAAVSRLAMYVDGKLMEGGVIERQRGRNVYENIVYQRRDPALLEWMKGNEFRVRVFPLPPRTEKRVILSYTQPLHSAYGAYHLTVPIPEIDLPVGKVEYRINVDDDDLVIESDSHPLEHSTRSATFTAQKAHIGDDLLLTLREETPRSSRKITYRDDSGAYLMARAHPTFTAPVEHRARSWAVLYDTSASRSPQELEAQATLARRFVREMDEDDRVALIAFDTEARTMEGGLARVGDLQASRLDTFLREQSRMAAGVTNLSLGLDAALGLLAGEDAEKHILYLGDGTITEGSSELEAIRQRVAGKATVVGVSVGDGADARTLAALASASGGLSLEINPGEDLAWRAFEVMAMLNSPRIIDVEATLLDSEGNALEGIDPLPSSHMIPHGECISVLARGEKTADVHSVRLSGDLAGEEWSQTIELASAGNEAAYLPRLWAQARIDSWLLEDAQAHREEITKLGLSQFLLTPFTSLLVLETEKMYEQFEVTRPDAKGWAHYDAPAKIDVVSEPIGTDPFGGEPTGDQLILRDPIQILQWPQQQLNAVFSGPFALDGTIGLGNLGLIGTGRGGGGVGEGTIGLTGGGYGKGSGGGLSSWMANSLDERRAAAPVGSAAEVTEDSIVRTGEEMSRTLDFKRAEVSGANTKFADARATKATSAHRRFRNRQQAGRWWGGEGRISTRGWGGLGHYYGTSGVPYPVALHYASDYRLDDLTNFVPAMLADEYDMARESILAASADREPGSVSTEARELIDAARAAAPTGRYRLGSASELSLDSKGRFWIERTTPEGLVERVVYDGERAYGLYDELGLAVSRRIGPTSPMLLGLFAPWMMAPADDLARWYTVEKTGPRTLRLSTPAGDSSDAHGESFEIELDDNDRIVALRHGEDTTELSYSAGGVAITADGVETTYERLGSESTFAPVDEARWTVVSMPVFRPAYWTAKLEGLDPGRAAWRHAQRQRMASASALGDSAQIARAFRELLAQVEELTPGELVLASGAASALTRAELSTLRDKARDTDAVVDYIAAAHAQRGSWSARPYRKTAKKHTDGLVGTMAAYRATLSNIDYGYASGERRRIEQFVDTHGDSALAYVLVQRASQYFAWNRTSDAVAMWKKLATHPQWKTIALHSAGTALSSRGKYADAADLFEEAIESALAADQAPIFDWQVRQALQVGRGNASFQLVWSRWRGEALASENLAVRAAFVSAAQQLGEVDDIHRIVTTTKPEQLEDVVLAIGLVDQLLLGNMPDDAWILIRRLLEPEGAGTTDAAVLDRAATVSEMQGRTADAAGYLERAMKADEGQAVPLVGLRADYARLIGLHTRLAQSQLTGDDASEHRDHALRIAAQWRREDPDNPEIDRLCAALYIDEPDQAWRHLSSVVERHPAEGSAYEIVAKALEREGQLRRADLMWQRAMEVEPTNPTWHLRRAENLAALGHENAAVELLDEVAEGDWQDRFNGIEWQAKQLRSQLD